MAHDIETELAKGSDSDKIIDMAKNDSDWHVRQSAVEHIEDEDVLKDILVNDPITSVSIKAMERIGDIDFLADVCLNNPFSHIRLAILNRICDESLLSGGDLTDFLNDVVFNDPDYFIVKSAVENKGFNDQKVLIDIAQSKRGEEIRRIAVSRITDERILSDLALNDSSVFLRREAILNPHLTDFDVLAQVIKNDCDEFNRHWACEKITDRDYLLGLVFDESFYHRLDVFTLNSNLDCEDYFKEIFENEDDKYCRIASVSFIRDELFLSDIVLNENNEKVRLEAVKNKHFTNQEILEKLLLIEDNPEILFHAVPKVRDGDALADFIKSHLDDGKATLEAILNINDVDFLNELLKNSNPKIRLYAVRSISENFKGQYDSLLKDIALSDEDQTVCLEATGTVTDSYDLIEIAENSGDRKIRALALMRIPAPRLLDVFLFTRQSLDFDAKLKALALDEDDDEIRQIAISKLGDKETLDNIVSLKNRDYRVAKRRLDTLFEDIKRIDNERQLKILISSADSDVSYVAQKTLNDLINSQRSIDEINQTSDIGELKKIFNENFNYYVRCEAEGRLEKLIFNVRLDEIDEKANQDRFREILMDETLPFEIRNMAFSKISDERFKKDNGIVLNSSKNVCPDCGGTDIGHDEFGFYCKNCGLIIK